MLTARVLMCFLDVEASLSPTLSVVGMRLGGPLRSIQHARICMSVELGKSEHESHKVNLGKDRIYLTCSA